MSYIQIEIGGKPRGLKFNQLAIEVLTTHNDGTNSALVYGMVYGGLRGNSYVKREEADYTFEQVCDWVDEMKDRATVIASVSATLAETQLWKDLIETAVGDADKKKVIRQPNKKRTGTKT